MSAAPVPRPPSGRVPGPAAGRTPAAAAGDPANAVPPVWREIGWAALHDSRKPLWAVIDGVSWPGIAAALVQAETDHCCLFSTLDPESRAMAPWLVRVDPGGEFARQLSARAHDDHSYILLSGGGTLEEMRAHLRRFTMLSIPDSDAPVYFRFYDPRVMIDAIEAMPESFLDSFAQPLDAIILPLALQCLMPGAGRFAGPAIDPFDDAADYQGRLLEWQRGAATAAAATRRGPGHVSEPEMAAMGARMQRRAILKLARRLHDEFGDLTTQNRCLTVAEAAPAHAARFELTSLAEVTLVARAQLLFGKNFDERHPEAGHILNDSSLLNWQKSDRLGTWFDDMLAAYWLEQEGETA